MPRSADSCWVIGPRRTQAHRSGPAQSNRCQKSGPRHSVERNQRSLPSARSRQPSREIGRLRRFPDSDRQVDRRGIDVPPLRHCWRTPDRAARTGAGDLLPAGSSDRGMLRAADPLPRLLPRCPGRHGGMDAGPDCSWVLRGEAHSAARYRTERAVPPIPVRNDLHLAVAAEGFMRDSHEPGSPGKHHAPGVLLHGQRDPGWG